MLTYGETPYVYYIAYEYYKIDNAGIVPNDTKDRILAQIDQIITNGFFHDYFVIKTFVVIEILSNLIEGEIQLAQSLFELLELIVDKKSEEMENVFDYGKDRIANFTLSEIIDDPNSEHLMKDESLQILMGLYLMGYRFNKKLLKHCPDELLFVHYI